MAVTVHSGKKTATKCNRNNAKREIAAQLVADDRLTDAKIAEKIGIDRVTLHRWKQQPAFAKRVNAISSAHAERALRYGLTRIERRLRDLNDIYSRIWQLIEERAADPSLQDVPGGKTGLITLADG